MRLIYIALIVIFCSKSFSQKTRIPSIIANFIIDYENKGSHIEFWLQFESDPEMDLNNSWIAIGFNRMAEFVNIFIYLYAFNRF